MEAEYKFYIVINGTDFPIQMLQESASDEEAKDFLKQMQHTESLWIGLENGDMIAVNQYLTTNVYFKAMRL
jgi:hypothetical protein